MSSELHTPGGQVEQGAHDSFRRKVFGWVASRVGRSVPQIGNTVDLRDVTSIDAGETNIVFQSARKLTRLVKESFWQGVVTGDIDNEDPDSLIVYYPHDNKKQGVSSKVSRLRVKTEDVLKTLTSMPDDYNITPDQVISTITDIYRGIRKAGKALEYRALEQIASLMHTSVGYTFLKENRDRCAEIADYAVEDKPGILSLEREHTYELSDLEEDEVWSDDRIVTLNRLGIVVDADLLLSSLLSADFIKPWDIQELTGNEEIKAFYLSSGGNEENASRFVFQIKAKDAELLMEHAMKALDIPQGMNIFLVSSYLEAVKNRSAEDITEYHFTDFAPKFFRYLVKKSRDKKDN